MPPILPILLTVNVPLVRSLGLKVPVLARDWRRKHSAAMSVIERAETFLMLGTRRPEGVSIATPMLI